MSKKIIRSIFIIFMCCIMCCTCLTGCGKKIDQRNLTPFENTLFNLSAVDNLGRKIAAADGYRDEGNCYVGLWYSLWQGQHPELQTSIKDIQKLLDMGEQGQKQLRDKSDCGQFYFWGEPLYGYYSMTDPFVLTRHIELFTMAGIDFLCIDATNAFYYPEPCKVLFELLKKFQSQGFAVPKVCFYTNTSSGTTVSQIYKEYYKDELHNDIWFAPNGRPLIVGITENNNMASDQTKYNNSKDFISPTLQRYFEVKESEWPNGMYNENSMPWMSWEYPQQNHSGYVAVPVAQHGHDTISASHMAPESHRGYNNITQVVEGDYREGLSFQQMWNVVHENKDAVNTVLVCSWNEWIAQKQQNLDFVDVYNWEYSRDIEMMKGGYGDNYYMQLVKNIREYKYKGAVEYSLEEQVIDISDISDLQWEKSHKYMDFKGDAIVRNHKDCAGDFIYKDESARNDIVEVDVTHDKENLYFRIITADNITEYNGTENWMNILVSTSEQSRDNFYGYEYIINRKAEEGKTSVEKCSGGYKWEEIGSADCVVEGNTMMIKIPLNSLGLSAKNYSLEFKVSDNVTHYDDIMDYYITGDSAPVGRLNFIYG